jgi:nitrate reductase gamma subunit
VSAGEILLWIILPYAAVATFIVGTWWRYRADQFGWTSGSTQIFEQKILGWAGPAFHYGALAAIGGHVIGLMIPKAFTEAVGMSESTYRWFSAIAGAVAGAVCVVGFVGLVYPASPMFACGAPRRGPICSSTSSWWC